MKVTLSTGDGTMIDVESSIARASTLIGNLLDDLGESEEKVIPLNAIERGEILIKGMKENRHIEPIALT